MPFDIPMIWREPRVHEDSYFCVAKIDGFRCKNKNKINYPEVSPVTKPILHEAEHKLPSSSIVIESEISSSLENENIDQVDCERHASDNNECIPLGDVNPKPLSQGKLNDLDRDLDLPKEDHILAPDIAFSCYRNREDAFLSFFEQTETLVYCTDVPKLMKTLGLKDYNADEFRLFIDSSKRSLKAVLLSNGIKVASVPIAHSVHLKETYENLKILLQSIQYDKHHWSTCGDIKVIGLLLS